MKQQYTSGSAKRMAKTEKDINCLVKLSAQLWHTILTRMNITSKMLQSSTLDINNADALLSSLKEFIESLNAQFDVFEDRGKSSATITTFQAKRKRVNIRDDVLTGDSELIARERFKVESFLVVTDKLTSSLVTVS